MNKLFIDINPMPASRPRVPRFGKVYYAKPYKEYRDAVAEWIVDNAERLEGLRTEKRLDVRLNFNVRRPKTTKLHGPKPDIDNYIKAVLDSLNGVIWADDYQIVAVFASKAWADAEKQVGTYLQWHTV